MRRVNVREYVNIVDGRGIFAIRYIYECIYIYVSVTVQGARNIWKYGWVNERGERSELRYTGRRTKTILTYKYILEAEQYGLGSRYGADL